MSYPAEIRTAYVAYVDVGRYAVTVHFEELVKRAATNPPVKRRRQRWAAIRDLFAVGSTTAVGICKYFGLDPEETIKAPRR